MSGPHTDLVNDIRVFISKIGGVSAKVDTPGLVYTKDGKPFRLGKKGTLDIAATVKGRAVWIDAKIGSDKLKGKQPNFVKAQERAGGIAFAAWSVADVAERLKQEGLIDG